MVALVEGLGMIFDKLKTWGALIGCAILAVLLVLQTLALHKAERRADKAEGALATERADWADERANAATALAFAATQAREKEQALAAAAHQSEEIKNAEIATLATRAADLRRRLRNAEANAATARLLPGAAAVASTSEVEPGSNIAGFSGELGSRLVSEAERGEKIRISLLACYRQYEDARKAVSLLSP